MADEKSSAEALMTQLPLDEVKRILTDRFAREVAAETGRRLWRPITAFGLPGIVLFGSLLWHQLDSSVASRVTTLQTSLTTQISNQVGTQVTQLFAARSEVARLEARIAIDSAFQGAQGAALDQALADATKAERFTAQLSSIVSAAMRGFWTAESPQLRSNFLVSLANDPEFRGSFARDVEQVLSREQAVPRIIAGALQQSLLGRRGDDRGQTVALALLAAVDQSKANEVVRTLLERSQEQGSHEVAIGALAAVSFASLTNEGRAASAMLTAALDAWSAHCGMAACGTDRALGEAMAAFLRLGRDLSGVDREAWIGALKAWHEGLIAAPTSRSRDASFLLVPRALAEIGTADAVGVITGWAVSANTELVLSSTQAIAGLPADTLRDRERIALFRTLWARVAAGDGVNLAVEEAAWMAIGQISNGAASATSGPWMTEAVELRGYLARQDRRSNASNWVAARPGARLGAPEIRPLAAPCRLGSDASAGLETDERAARLRADICALAALLRVGAGANEWYALRPPLVQRERMTLLGLLWALAVDRERDRGILTAEARFAPLNDLLLSQQPTPPGFHLAALLLLRSVPDRAAWQTMTALNAEGADSALFLAATRWMYRPTGDDAAWFAEQLVAMPPPRRAALLDMLLGSVSPGLPEAQGTPLARLTSAASRQLTVGLVNALALAALVDKSGLLEAAERENLFGRLQDIMAGRARDAAPRNLVTRVQLALLAEAGWTPAWQSLQTVEAVVIPAPLVPTHAEQFGRLRIPDGAVITLEGPPRAQITLFHAETHQTRILRSGEPWTVSNPAEGEIDAWLFRVATPAEGLRLAVVTARPIDLAAADTSQLAALELGVPFRVASLRADTAGFARIDGVRRGERLRITTFGLGRRVDTVVAVMLGTEVVAEDDDGANDGLASQLDWTADRAGPAVLRVTNIGLTGAFNLLVTRLEE